MKMWALRDKKLFSQSIILQEKSEQTAILSIFNYKIGE